jgi:hypothetical protein
MHIDDVVERLRAIDIQLEFLTSERAELCRTLGELEDEMFDANPRAAVSAH